MAFDQGFQPDFAACARCGALLSGDDAGSPPPCAPETDPDMARGHACSHPSQGLPRDMVPARFLVEQGKLLCGDCGRWGKGASVLLGRESLDVLRAVCAGTPGEWADRTVAARERLECGRALDLFVTHHLGLTWDHGSFRRI